ncbi:MAG TPA: VTT domain-containing protein [Cytophagaceae bacterium]
MIDPEKLILYGGLSIILLVVFIENGVFFGFFLPGDTLLFTAGLLCATGKLEVSIATLLITVSLAGILGNLFGYVFGLKMGQKLYNRKDSLLFKKKYIVAAEAFFNKYGGLALIMGRFLPIIRTFAPIFAGIVRFDFRNYLMFNIIGGIVWAVSMQLAGYFLGTIFPSAKENLEYIIIAIVVITWIPVITTYIKERRNKAKASNPTSTESIKN